MRSDPVGEDGLGLDVQAAQGTFRSKEAVPGKGPVAVFQGALLSCWPDPILTGSLARDGLGAFAL